MSGVYISDDAEVVSRDGEKGIFIPRAFFGKEGEKKDSLVFLPIKCTRWNIGDYIEHGWLEGLIVDNSETGDPYIRPALSNEGTTTLILTAQYTTARIHKLLNGRKGCNFSTHVELFAWRNPATLEKHVRGAIVSFRGKVPGDVVRLLRRGGIDGEDDRFFICLPDGRIDEVNGIDGTKVIYTQLGVPLPFGIIEKGSQFRANENDWSFIR